MKINYKKLLVCILIPVLLGSLIGLITKNYINYEELIKPAIAPNPIVFPIVWTILYILMGISSYIVLENKSNNQALKVYGIQLVINLLWSIIFFIFKFYLLSFIWIIILIFFVILMIFEFYGVNKKAAYLQIPYLIWIMFAAILNLSIYFLN